MKRKFTILTLLLSLWTGAIAAESDSTTQFNVADNILMRLYRKPHKDAFRKGFFSNFELSAYWNPDYLLTTSEGSYSWNAMSGGVSLTKDLTRTHSLRLGFDFSRPAVRERYDLADLKFNRWQIDLGWMWNLSNYYGGYDLLRKHYAIATAGLFYGQSKAIDWDVKDNFFGGWLGLQYRYVLSPRVSLFSELQYRLARKAYGGFNEFDDNLEPVADNEKQIATSMAMLMGANVRLSGLYKVNASKLDSKGYKIIDNLFGQVAGGFTAVDGKATPNIDIAIGKWMSPKYGVRLSAHDNFRMLGGRGELLLNPIAMFSKHPSWPLWGFDLGVGAELGSIKLNKVDGTQGVDKGFYFGPTVSGQLKYFLSPWTALFLEGRYTLANTLFDQNASQPDAQKGTATINLGIETFHTDFARFYNTRTQEPKRVSTDLRDTYWIEYGAKLQRLTTHDPNDVYTNGGFSFAFGRHFSPTAALRIRAELQSMNQVEIDSIDDWEKVGERIVEINGERVVQYDYQRVSKASKIMPMLSVDYVYNISNSWMGVDPQRHFDLNLYAGMLFAYEGLEQFDMGFEIGAQLSHRLSPNWNIFLDPHYQWLYKIDTYHGRWNLGAGARYTFIKRRRSAMLDRSRWYIQALLGAQLFGYDMKTKQTVSTFKSVFSSGGEGHGLKHMNFDVALGRQIDPVWGVRASIFAQEFKVREGVGLPQEDETSMQMWGLRAEAVFNLLRSFSPKLERSRWNFAIMAGLQMSHLIPESKKFNSGAKHALFGFTGAGQLQYRLTNSSWLVGETRAQLFSVNDPNLVMTASVGVQHDFYYRKRGDLTKRTKNRWYFGGGVGMMDAHVGTFEFFVGDNLSAVHGIRLGLTYTDSPMRNVVIGHDPATGEMRMDHYSSLGLDYTYHLSNRLWGVDPGRYVDIQLLTGLELGFSNLQDLVRTGDGGLFKIYPGLNLGAHATGHIANGISWYIEPRLSLLFSKNLMTAYEPNDISEPFNYFTTVGLQFEINPYKQVYKWVERPDKNYVAAKLIVQPTAYADRAFVSGGGIGGEITYGRWWNDFIGTEFTGTFYNFKQFSKKQQFYGGRIDFTADLTAAMNPDWRRKPFQLVGLIGLEGGMFQGEWNNEDFIGRGTDYEEYRHRVGDSYLPSTGEKKFTIGPAFGLDLRWRHHGTAPVGVSLGTRLHTFKYEVESLSGEKDAQYFMPLSIDLGIHYNF